MVPFRLVECGCVVIPLGDYASAERGTQIRCVCLNACDGDGEDPYGFSPRTYPATKLVNGRALTEDELTTLIDQLGVRVIMGQQMNDLAGLFRSVQRMAERVRV